MKKLAVLLVFLFLAFSACKQPAGRDESILRELHKRRDEHFQFRLNDCNQKLQKSVEAHVDSVLYLEIVLGLHGDVEIPDRPDRGGDTIGYDIILDTSSLELKDAEKFRSHR